MKRFIALVLSLVMALSLCAPAWGAETGKDVATADELVDAFANLKAGDVINLTADIDMTGKTITPVTGNKGFTLNGNGKTISNLASTERALFVAHSGSSSYTFDGVVLENCSVTSALNYGALFVGDGDTSDAITITNCHVKNCTVSSAKYAAAFVAYTAGWDVQDDGPVYSDVTITDCSVTGGSITGGGSVGAAIGHAGGNVDTTNTITNFKVDGVAITGEDAEHTGIVVGTAHVGETIINNATYSNVTGNYNTTTNLYGRFVPGSTGTLEIDGIPAGSVAQVGDEYFKTLAEAVAAADGKTVTLLDNCSGAGIFLAKGSKNITIDFKGKTFTCTGPAVGSAGTVTQAFHLEEGNTVTLKNGTITSAADSNVKMLVQNYCNLTLTNMVLDGTALEGTAPHYVLSNNCGNVVIENTNIKATAGDFAFDTCKYASYAIPTVTVKGSSVIGGAVEASGGKLAVENGSFDGAISVIAPGVAADISVTGGTFSADPKAYVVDGYKAVEGNGVYTVMKTYNVTFDANGGKGEYTLAPVVVGKFVLPENPFTAPEGKIFKAWSVDGVEYAAGEEIDVAADVKVTALWMNAPVEVEDDVMVQVTDPVMIPNPELTVEEKAIADEVDVSEICTEAMTKVVEDVASEDVSEAVIKEKTAELDALIPEDVSAEDVVVVVQTNFEVKVEAVSVEGDKTTVTLDITPVYQKVVTTETIANSGAKIEANKNAVVAEKGELDLKGKEVEITIAIPDVLVDLAVDKDGKKVLYVNHTKDDKVKTTFVYEAEVNVTEKTATFFNPNGFSFFTISATNSTVAYVEESDMSYATIESAIGDAGKGAVIEVLVSDQVVDITAPCSFKLKLAEDVDEPTFNVAKGYTMSKWYVNGVYTYIVQSASAGGYAPSTTPEKVVTSADTFDAGIALYVGMSVMAAVGSAVVLKKRED